MLKKNLFKKPSNELENYGNQTKRVLQSSAEESTIKCPSCNLQLNISELGDYHYVCRKCGHHFRINARQRIGMIFGKENFTELYPNLTSDNVLDFPDYNTKLEKAYQVSDEKEAVVCGIVNFEGRRCAVFAMEPFFMMGSMGRVVGEKITRTFEYATKEKLPVIAFTVSGGARMQEGIFSLMQMAKTSGAVKRHSDDGNLYIAVLTDPTTGGVLASFAMQADVIIAEPNAFICFAGPRVIEQTIRHKLPKGFQRAELLLNKGFIDAIVDRRQQRMFLKKLLEFHPMETEL